MLCGIVKFVLEGLSLEGLFPSQGVVVPDGVWSAVSEALDRGIADANNHGSWDAPECPQQRNPADCKVRAVFCNILIQDCLGL